MPDRLPASNNKIIGQIHIIHNNEYLKILFYILYNYDMDLNTLIIIEKIDSLGTFSAAAKALKLPNSNLSLKVKQLEEDLGQSLFIRSTRQVVITEFGRHVLEEARPLIDAKNRIESLAEEQTKEPSGMMRLTAPYDMGLYLLRSIVPKFSQEYPKIRVEIELNNSYVDIISGGFDLAIRASSGGGLTDSSIVAVKLASTYLRLYANKRSRFAKIRDLETLNEVPILSMGREIKLVKDGQSKVVYPKSQIVVKDMAGIKHATIGMAGVGVIPEFICHDEISRNILTNVFPGWSAGKGIFYAMYPKQVALTSKSRLFIEFLKEQFKLNGEYE